MAVLGHLHFVGCILLCWTLVGLAYHSREPFAPQVLEGIATALIPLGILYLLLAYFGVFKSRKEI